MQLYSLHLRWPYSCLRLRHRLWYSGDYYYNNYNPGCGTPCCNPCPAPCCPTPCCPAPCSTFDCSWANCLWVKGEALWTRASDSGLAFATGDKKKFLTSVGATFKEKVFHPHQHWEWGWRAGAGTRFCDCWDVYGGYTQLKDKASGSRGNSGPFYVLPIYGEFTVSSDSPGTANVHADWHLKIDYADIVISRTFCLGNCVSIKPHAGGRYVRIHSHYDIKNHFVSTLLMPYLPVFDVDFVVTNELVSLQNRFNGYGISAGLDGLWDVGCGLVIETNATGSIVYGQNHFSYNEAFNSSGAKFKNVFTDSTNAARYIVDLGAVLKWETTCGCGTWGIFAGYEAHLYFNANNFYNNGSDILDPSIAEGARSDICVQGGRFGAFFRF